MYPFSPVYIIYNIATVADVLSTIILTSEVFFFVTLRYIFLCCQYKNCYLYTNNYIKHASLNS